MNEQGLFALFPDWFVVTETNSAWRKSPGNELIRWHVSYWQRGQIGHQAGRTMVITETGYYWYTTNWSTGVRFSSSFGPFTSLEAALADCEAAHKS